MNDYLWDKSGSDADIERIEAMLQTLAYRPTAPPELPAKQLVFTPPRRPYFGFSVSLVAASLAVLAFAIGWFLVRNEMPTTQQASVRSSAEQPVTPVRTEAAPVSAETPKVSAPRNSKRRVAPRRPTASDAIRPQTLVLTKEEADAYRQLMTALNITSTNLKIVKDKLDGTE